MGDIVDASINPGDVVLYRNSKSNVRQCEVERVKMTDSGLWFHGVDLITKAKVFYPYHKTRDLMDGAKWQSEQ